jgi:uncharacterized protein YcaQ
LGAYDPAQLETLLWRERQLFEYWAHAASIVLTEDFPIHQHHMRGWPDGSSAWSRRVRTWLAENESFQEYVLAELSAQGPLSASQLENQAVTDWQSGGWTTNRNVSQMLSYLWLQGQIMVARRAGLTKYWDLTERCLPGDVLDQELTEQEMVYQAAQRSLRALGVARPEQIKAHFIRSRYPNLGQTLRRLEHEGRIVPVQITKNGQAWPGRWYVHAADLPLLERLITRPDAWQPRTTLLSPFDNLICDRTRTEMLFDFKFRIEIYVPKAKRQYGYYVLPILYGDRLIGRIDPKMDRKQGRLTINAVYAEPDAPQTQEVAQAIAGAIQELGRFLGAKEIDYSRENIPAAWQETLYR